ncbi:hypothetical protein EX30DRAFT_374857 [Ascodesmis nigricans]|uniref:Uncharacterized protein n=1 Tax=Ascodesmis nigricans TaxID=341454 RepID=A0A4S2MJS4_9PEZI|nr:hypothetical protein EX30DRAFT_374857 [Ascodesmis nigricans]
MPLSTPNPKVRNCMITPRRRAVILDLPETIVKDVEQNALSQAAQKHGIDLDSSSKAEARRVILLNYTQPPGAPAKLTAENDERLVKTVKNSCDSRRMRLDEVILDAEIPEVSRSTVALHHSQSGVKAYRENTKFIPTPENRDKPEVRAREASIETSG